MVATHHPLVGEGSRVLAMHAETPTGNGSIFDNSG
jgi:hypothetical protein